MSMSSYWALVARTAVSNMPVRLWRKRVPAGLAKSSLVIRPLKLGLYYLCTFHKILIEQEDRVGHNRWQSQISRLLTFS